MRRPPVAPPQLTCVPRRDVNTVRFLKACLFTTVGFSGRHFAERRWAENSPTPLTVAARQALSLGRGRPAPRSDLGERDVSRQEVTSPLASTHQWECLRTTPPDPALVHLAEHRDPPDTVERHLLGELEKVKLCPSAQQSHFVARRRRANPCVVEVENVLAAVSSQSLDLPFRECFRVTTAARARIHSASPNHASALSTLATAASMCSQGSEARQRWSLKNASSPTGARVRSPRKGSSTFRDSRRTGHVELANEATEHLGTWQTCDATLRPRP